jgi:hypothetical protein
MPDTSLSALAFLAISWRIGRSSATSPDKSHFFPHHHRAGTKSSARFTRVAAERSACCVAP